MTVVCLCLLEMFMPKTSTPKEILPKARRPFPELISIVEVQNGEDMGGFQCSKHFMLPC